MRDLPASVLSQADSFSAKGSSLLGRSGTLNFGSTAPARRYLRIVLRDSPVRRAISRIGIPSRKCQRRITLNNAMSITPLIPRPNSQGEVQNMGHFSVEISALPGSALSGNQQTIVLLLAIKALSHSAYLHDLFDLNLPVLVGRLGA